MLVGKLLYKRSYLWYKYVSVVMICVGISIFTGSKPSKSSSTSENGDYSSLPYQIFGLMLVLANLSLDGITSNEQDQIFAEQKPTPLQMMKYANGWQALYMAGYIVIDLFIYMEKSNIVQAGYMIFFCETMARDLLGFCLCACAGQVVLFGLIKEFGSLVWITVSVTRQLFTILLSVFLFNHRIIHWQWLGIALVFSGLGFEIIFTYINKAATSADPIIKRSVTSGSLDIENYASAMPSLKPKKE